MHGPFHVEVQLIGGSDRWDGAVDRKGAIVQLLPHEPLTIALRADGFGFSIYLLHTAAALLRRCPAGDLTALRVDGFGFILLSRLL
jgi:hypothetical protein